MFYITGRLVKLNSHLKVPRLWITVTVLHGQHRTPLHCTVLHCIALHCTALHCSLLHCGAVRCTSCTAIHYTRLLNPVLERHKTNTRYKGAKPLVGSMEGFRVVGTFDKGSAGHFCAVQETMLFEK